MKAQCGTATMYRQGCRCEPCRAANTAKLGDYRKRRAERSLDLLVSAELCREHLRRLARAGLGYRAVSEASDVAWCTVRKIRSGAVRRIRESTERRLMRVNAAAIADFGKVSSKRTRRLVDALRQRGWSLAEIGRMVGNTKAQFYYNSRITARTALRVEKLHRKLVHVVPAMKRAA